MSKNLLRAPIELAHRVNVDKRQKQLPIAMILCVIGIV